MNLFSSDDLTWYKEIQPGGLLDSDNTDPRWPEKVIWRMRKTDVTATGYGNVLFRVVMCMHELWVRNLKPCKMIFVT